MIHFIMIYPSTPDFSKWLLPSVFLKKQSPGDQTKGAAGGTYREGQDIQEPTHKSVKPLNN
jgi:hypothetical protein